MDWERMGMSPPLEFEGGERMEGEQASTQRAPGPSRSLGS